MSKAWETRACALLNPSADVGGVSRQCAGRVLPSDPIRADDRAGARALYRRPLSTRRLLAYERYFSF